MAALAITTAAAVAARGAAARIISDAGNLSYSNIAPAGLLREPFDAGRIPKKTDRFLKRVPVKRGGAIANPWVEGSWL